MTAIVSVLVLAIIGLTIGLVIVASQASLSSNMNLSYSVNEVECTITASGTYQEAAIKCGTVAETFDQDSITVTATKGTTTTGAVYFQNVTLTATDIATYTFAITNNSATVGIARDITVTLTDNTGNTNAKIGNVVVKINGEEITSASTTKEATIEASGNEDIVITCQVADSTLPANVNIAIAMNLVAAN